MEKALEQLSEAAPSYSVNMKGIDFGGEIRVFCRSQRPITGRPPLMERARRVSLLSSEVGQTELRATIYFVAELVSDIAGGI